MLSLERSAPTDASPEVVWKLWTDAPRWCEADHVESASIDGKFEVGAKIRVKVKGSPANSLVVTRVEPHDIWVDESHVPGMRMTFEHVIEATPAASVLTERALISGPLGRVFGLVMRRRLEAILAESVASLAHIAEQDAGNPRSIE